MIVPQPIFIVIAGPNGSGKSTAAALLLPRDIPFLNADEVAKKLPVYPSTSADMEASRIVLSEMDAHEINERGFAFETTLASRSLAPRIVRLHQAGYFFQLLFAFLPDPELAIARVAARVRQGGHDIPEVTIRRRFQAGLSNFFRIYLPLADHWSAYDTSVRSPVRLIAEGNTGHSIRVEDQGLWHQAVIVAMERHRESGVPVATWDWTGNCVLLIAAEDAVPLESDCLIEASKS
jgi:predicted ABC-type ATPase